MSAQVSYISDAIKLALVGAGYTFSTGHSFYSDLTPATNVVGTPQALSGKAVSGGVFTASSPVTFSNVTGPPVTQLIYYKDTGVASSSPLLAYLDTVTGLPVTPNGGNISVNLSSAAPFGTISYALIAMAASALALLGFSGII